MLNALKEVHLLLAEGAHNQFGDLPWTARSEMMLTQWIQARPEIRDFLQSRIMLPYRSPGCRRWTRKTLQEWSDVTVRHFRDLAVYREQTVANGPGTAAKRHMARVGAADELEGRRRSVVL